MTTIRNYIDLLTWSLIFFFSSLNVKAGSVNFTITSEEACPECMLNAKKQLEAYLWKEGKLKLSFKELFKNQNNVKTEKSKETYLIINDLKSGWLDSQVSSVTELENTFFNEHLKKEMNLLLKPFLGQESYEYLNKIQFRLFYQIELGSDQQLKIEPNEARKSPHNFYAFFHIFEGVPYIFFDAHQVRSRAYLSVGHELIHIFDKWTEEYINKWKSDWTILDDFALELRAHFLEETLEKNRNYGKKASEQWGVLKDDNRKTFSDRDEIFEFVMNKFFLSNATHVLGGNEKQLLNLSVPIWENVTESKQTLNIPNEEIEKGSFHIFTWMMQKILEKEEMSSQSRELKAHIGRLIYIRTEKAEVKERSKKEKENFLNGLKLILEKRKTDFSYDENQNVEKISIKYFEQQNLFKTNFKFRNEGFNNWPQKNGGPKERDGGE